MNTNKTTHSPIYVPGADTPLSSLPVSAHTTPRRRQPQFSAGAEQLRPLLLLLEVVVDVVAVVVDLAGWRLMAVSACIRVRVVSGAWDGVGVGGGGGGA